MNLPNSVFHQLHNCGVDLSLRDQILSLRGDKLMAVRRPPHSKLREINRFEIWWHREEYGLSWRHLATVYNLSLYGVQKVHKRYCRIIEFVLKNGLQVSNNAANRTIRSKVQRKNISRPGQRRSNRSSRRAGVYRRSRRRKPKS